MAIRDYITKHGLTTDNTDYLDCELISSQESKDGYMLFFAPGQYVWAVLAD